MPDDNNDLLEELLTNDGDDLGTDEKTLSENEKLAPLLEEINLITDTTVRLFVRAILLHAPDHYWSAPASLSGKHHPPDERAEGGNVLHTQRVVRLATLICEAQERTAYEFDMIIAAALLHDVTKHVLYNNELKYDKMHPYTVDPLVEKVREEQGNDLKNAGPSLAIFLDDEFVQQILRLVRCHLGIWSPIPETVPVTSLEWSLHLADLIASRLHLVSDGTVS